MSLVGITWFLTERYVYHIYSTMRFLTQSQMRYGIEGERHHLPLDPQQSPQDKLSTSLTRAR
jgi:hypothetical protein